MREPDAIEILEAAVGLLRAAPAGTLAIYLTGSVPFSLGLLFFWTDMARNPFASERLAAESLGVAALFLWKSVWQAMFQARLYRQISLPESSPGSWPRFSIMRLIAIQSGLQPFSLLAIPVSFVLTIPFAGTFAFFRNAGLFAALGTSNAIALARRQAGLWKRQNWYVLSYAWLATLLLFMNVLITIMLLPQLGRMLLGIEGDFARLGIGLLNLTTIAVAGAITWLFMDALFDAVYVLRCFHGESLATGEDLRMKLRQATGAVALAILCLFLFGAGASPARAQAANAQLQTVNPERLNAAIDEVVRRREFAWRFPHPRGPEPQGRWVGWVRKALQTIGDGAKWLVDKIRTLFQDKQDVTQEEKPPAQRAPLEIWMAGAIVALVGVAVAIFLRRSRTKVIMAEPVKPVAVVVDLSDESLTADQMPESSWLQLADELLTNGDCRLALRALYLAGLNYLSTRELVTLRSWKSGGDYRRELERRVRADSTLRAAQVTPVFARNVAAFERGWYGRHPVERAEVQAFALGLEEIKRNAGGA